jgi:hypothetical protein
MRVYTAHLRRGRMPLLVPEAFSLGAFLFGPLWLFAHRSWVAGIIAAAVLVSLPVLGTTLGGPPAVGLLLFAYAALLGFSGRDLQRWSLERRGFAETYVVAGRNRDAAYGRLLARDPTLAGEDLP